MATLLNPFLRGLDANGDAVSGALLYVFEAGTTTPVTTYSDSSLTTPQDQPLEANSAGEFEGVFLESGTYKIRVSDAGDVVLYENDFVRMADRPDDPVSLDDEVAVAADTTSYADGTVIFAIGEATYFKVAPSGATTYDLTNAAGEKLRHKNRNYLTVAALLATAEESRGTGEIWEAAGFRYEEVTTGEHLTTAGGVKLYVRGELNIAAFGVPNDGTAADMSVVDSAFAAAAGKQLRFPSGVYNFSRAPAGLDDVFAVGDPFTGFNGAAPVPLSVGVFSGNKQVAIVSAALRYYAADEVEVGSSAGWYLIQAKSGAHHDPVLLGPVSASGSGSIILDVKLDEFGIDTSLWTPSGFNCTADEGLASDGTIFGASVGMTSMTILGSHTTTLSPYISYNSANDGNGNDGFSASGAGYSFEWVSGATAYLKVTRSESEIRQAIGTSSLAPMLQTRWQGSGKVVSAHLESVVSDNEFRVRFMDHSTAPPTNMVTKDASMKMWVHDPMLRPPPFVFSQDPGPGRNIWIVGVFTRRAEDYP